MKGKNKPRPFVRGTPDPRTRPIRYTPMVVVTTSIVAVVLVLLLWRLPQAPFVDVLYKGEKEGNKSPNEHPVTPFKFWEADFECVLWTQAIVASLGKPPYLLESPEALVKSNVVNGMEYRSLMFDVSTEVQGSVAFDVSSGKPDFGHVVLEYTRAMCAAFSMVRGLDCKREGRALSLGLGAGTLANFIHAKLPQFHVDVIEIDPAIVAASRKFLGTPGEDDKRFHLFLGDATNVFSIVDPNVKYDIIVHDVYIPGPEIPPALVTVEFIQQCADRLTDDGVLVFNFCLPYYTSEEQVEIVGRFRRVFPNLWFMEGTEMSKILIGHKYPITDSKKALTAIREKHLDMQIKCNWPQNPRGLGYMLLLEEKDYGATFLRSLHREASRFYCEKGWPPVPYCKWFQPRDAVVREFPEIDLTQLEALLSKNGFDPNRVKAFLRKNPPTQAPKKKKKKE